MSTHWTCHIRGELILRKLEQRLVRFLTLFLLTLVLIKVRETLIISEFTKTLSTVLKVRETARTCELRALSDSAQLCFPVFVFTCFSFHSLFLSCYLVSISRSSVSLSQRLWHSFFLSLNSWKEQASYRLRRWPRGLPFLLSSCTFFNATLTLFRTFQSVSLTLRNFGFRALGAFLAAW